MNSGRPSIRIAPLFVVAVLFGLLSTWWLHQTPQNPVTISQGALMAMTLPDAEGHPHTLAEWQGRPIVINFWATWCLPCVEELPTLSQFASQPEFADVAVIGIAMDTPQAVQTFLKTHHLSYPVLQESQGIGENLQSRLGNPVGSLPFSAVINRQGRVVETRLGPWKKGELESHLRPLLVKE